MIAVREEMIGPLIVVQQETVFHRPAPESLDLSMIIVNEWQMGVIEVPMRKY